MKILLLLAAATMLAAAYPISENLGTKIAMQPGICRLNYLEAESEDWDSKRTKCVAKVTAEECTSKKYCWWDNSEATNYNSKINNEYMDLGAIQNPLPNVYTFFGTEGAYIAYCTAIVTDNSVILINSGESTEGTIAVKTWIAANIGKPIRWLFITHAHFDEISDGVTLWQLGLPNQLTVFVPKGYVNDLYQQSLIMPLSNSSLAGVNLIRNFGLSIPRDTDWRVALPLSFSGRPLAPPPLVNPPLPLVDFVYVSEGQTVALDNIHATFFETQADLVSEFSAYFPELQLLYAADVFEMCYPPLATYRGDPVRPVDRWIQSAAKLVTFCTTHTCRYMLSSSIPPQFSATQEMVNDIMANYLAFLNHISAHVVAGLAAGVSAENIENSYLVPDFVKQAELRYSPLFSESYHPIQLIIRGAIEGYVGVANNRYSQLLREPVTAKQNQLIDLAGGANHVVREAQRLVATAERNNLIFALELGEALVETNADVASGKLIMHQSCYMLGMMQRALTGRQYFLTCAWETRPVPYNP